MTMVRYRPDPNNPRRLTPEERARLEAMTEEDINRAALSDPDNLPMTDAELLQLTPVSLSKRTRAKTGLT